MKKRPIESACIIRPFKSPEALCFQLRLTITCTSILAPNQATGLVLPTTIFSKRHTWHNICAEIAERTIYSFHILNTLFKDMTFILITKY